MKVIAVQCEVTITYGQGSTIRTARGQRERHLGQLMELSLAQLGQCCIFMEADKLCVFLSLANLNFQAQVIVKVPVSLSLVPVHCVKSFVCATYIQSTGPECPISQRLSLNGYIHTKYKMPILSSIIIKLSNMS